MAEIKYTGNARAVRFPRHNLVFEPDETVEVSEEVAVEVARRPDFERPDIDPEELDTLLEMTVPEIEDELDTGDYDHDLNRIEAAEQEIDDRKGVYDAVEERRNESEG